MARDRNRERSNLGEQAGLTGEDVEREDRSMVGGAQGDRMAGSEGIEDQSIDRSHREDLESDRSMQGSEQVDESSRRDRNRSQKGKRGRQQGRESTDSTSRSFSGQGGQKEGQSEGEGTGYTREGNTEDLDRGKS